MTLHEVVGGSEDRQRRPAQKHGMCEMPNQNFKLLSRHDGSPSDREPGLAQLPPFCLRESGRLENAVKLQTDGGHQPGVVFYFVERQPLLS